MANIWCNQGSKKVNTYMQDDDIYISALLHRLQDYSQINDSDLS